MPAEFGGHLGQCLCGSGACLVKYFIISDEYFIYFDALQTTTTRGLNIQILHIQCIVFDELSTGLDVFSHQR